MSVCAYCGVSGGIGGAGAATKSGGGLTSAQRAVLNAALTVATKPSVWVAPGPKQSPSGVKGLRGDSIFFIGQGVNDFNTEMYGGVKAAAAVVGLHVLYSNELSATAAVADIDLALTEKVKAVIVECFDPSTISSALIKAHKEGVIVVQLCDSDVQPPTAVEKSDGVFANDTYCYRCAGVLMGDYAVLHTNGRVHAFIQDFQGLQASDLTIDGFTSVLKKYCPRSCTYSATDIPLTSSMTQVISSSAGAAVLNPSINTFVPVYDFIAGDDVPVVHSAHATSRIMMLTQNADLAEMQELASGTTSIQLEIGNPTSWTGWGAVDQALRGILGMPAVANENLPIRLFDSSNIKTVNLKADPGTWYGPSNYEADYRALWGV
jgi:ABC-type sugar transport system substrate-binding protein